MQQPLTPSGQHAVQDLAQRYGVSIDAVSTLLAAVSAGGGSMAQFYHPELGGGGQWMRGGMTMVGDMFNSRLQGTVSGLCAELSTLLGSMQVYAPPPPPSGGGFMGGPMLSSNSWWPAELGSPSSSGGQNDARYAYFPQQRRLAISRNGQVSIYDTLDHQIGGVQQQQGSSYGSLSFSSQFGTFTVDSLPLVSPTPPSQPFAPPPYAPPPPPPPPAPSFASAPAYSPEAPASTPPSSSSSNDIIGAIERLGQLRDRGIVTDAEFNAKKAELLSRL
ncbi:MAG TPA: SHOCT domain-containing protein [Polyangiaceae bacterium]|nr:SHOCT domain-containing protein [Polyangiaceae bacterium]